ncbi:MAG UNVERIFIED_CONTAM: hypothetical protein LVT10_02340 [Anaerolineae bacterium]|jgi:hypothetical protein
MACKLFEDIFTRHRNIKDGIGWSLLKGFAQTAVHSGHTEFLRHHLGAFCVNIKSPHHL